MYGAIIAVVLCVSILTTQEALQIKDRRYDGNRLRIVLNGVFAVGILLWPLLFDVVVGFDKLDMASGTASVLVAVGFLWPVVLIMVDMLHVCRRKKYADAHESRSREDELRGNANILIGGAWALGALLSVVKGSTGDYPQSREGAKIILVALLLCIGFVIPTASNPARSYESNMIRSGQKTMLNFAIGLFISGIAVSWAQ